MRDEHVPNAIFEVFTGDAAVSRRAKIDLHANDLFGIRRVKITEQNFLRPWLGRSLLRRFDGDVERV